MFNSFRIDISVCNLMVPHEPSPLAQLSMPADPSSVYSSVDTIMYKLFLYKYNTKS